MTRLPDAVRKLNRLRLENFVDTSLKKGRGCFGYSVVSEWSRLHPTQLLPDDISQKLIRHTIDSEVKAHQWNSIFTRLGLSFEISAIEVAPDVTNSANEIRTQLFQLDESVPVIFSDILQTREKMQHLPDPAIMYFTPRQLAITDRHTAAIATNPLIEKPLPSYGAGGGQEGFDWAVKNNFAIAAIVRLKSK